MIAAAAALILGSSLLKHATSCL